MTDLTSIQPIAEHPAKFNDAIIEAIQGAIYEHWDEPGEPDILDPMGGIGGIHLIPGNTYAVELQPGWAAQSALNGPTYCGNWLTYKGAFGFPKMFGIVATSCAYGNRMADKHNAKEDSKRLTYAHTLRRNGEELDGWNSGGMQWGDAYRDFHRLAWFNVAKILLPGGLFILNVKDHVRGGELQQVAKWHRDAILGMETFKMLQDKAVPVRGMGFGAHQQVSDGVKVDYEHVYVFRKVA